MSNQEMASRIKNILMEKTNLGMGYRKKRKGQKKNMGSSNSWITFLQRYSKKNNIPYNELLKNSSYLEQAKQQYYK